MRKMFMLPVVCVMLLSGLASFSQLTRWDNGDTFDYNGFINTADLLNWINNYELRMKDGIDSVLRYYRQHPPNTQNGGELYWFGIKESDGWHAVFGNFRDDTFQVKFEFLVDYTRGAVPDGIAADTSKIIAVAWALKNSEALVTKLTSGVKMEMKPAVRINPDKTIVVWMFPAPTRDSIAIVGVYGTYHFDSSGKQLLEKDEQFQGIKRYKVGNPASVHLEYPNRIDPPLDALYFAYFYSALMPEIVLSTSTHDIKTDISTNLLSWFVRSKTTGVTWTLSRL